jgi:hypothetical protein
MAVLTRVADVALAKPALIRSDTTNVALAGVASLASEMMISIAVVQKILHSHCDSSVEVLVSTPALLPFGRTHII